MAFEKQIDLIFFIHLFPVKGSEIIITNHFSIHHKIGKNLAKLTDGYLFK